MMSQIHCKQSIRIEKSGWFKHYFPGNLRRNILFKVCNYTSYQNLQKTSLPNPFAREKFNYNHSTTIAWLHSSLLLMDCSKVPLCKRPLTMAGYASACHGPQGSEEF